jgi:hypothetical protein
LEAKIAQWRSVPINKKDYPLIGKPIEAKQELFGAHMDFSFKLIVCIT